MNSVAYNLEKNTLCKIMILASAILIVVGIFVKYVDVSGVKAVSLWNMPRYCTVFFVIMAALMISSALANKMTLALTGSGIALVANVVFGILCKKPEFVVKMIYGSKAAVAGGIVNSIGNMFGIDNAAGSLMDLAGDYVNISLSVGFYMILVGGIVGTLFSIIDLAKQGSIPENRSLANTDDILNYRENRQGLLRCVSGEAAGTSIVMRNGDTIVLGRDPKISNVILREDKNISRRHCSISYRDGVFYIVDYSSNGTRLGNGLKLQNNVETSLGSQSSIKLSANTEFTVQIKQN